MNTKLTASKSKRIAPSTAPTSPLVTALNMIGDGWTFLIMREAFFRVRRFEDMRGGLAIPRSRLTERLRQLVTTGLLARIPYQYNPTRYEYKLTAMGLDIYDMTLMMKAWADKWRKGRFPRLRIVHSSCGARIRPIVVCASCERQVSPRRLARTHDRPIAQEGEIVNKRRTLANDVYDRGTRREGVAETLKVMGDQRSMAVLHEAFHHATRFDDLHERTGIARNTLTARLNHLVDEGVFKKKRYCERPARYEYQLTTAGWDLLLVELAMEQWGRRWHSDKQLPAPSYSHLNCGAQLNAAIVCKTCRKPIDPKDTRFV